MYLLIHAPLWKISFLPLGINYQTVLSLALCPYDETFVVNLLVNILCFPKEKPENKSYYYSGKTSLRSEERRVGKEWRTREGGWRRRQRGEECEGEEPQICRR